MGSGPHNREKQPTDCTAKSVFIRVHLWLPVAGKCSPLADEYVRAGIIPARFKNDALHVAVAVWHKLEVIVSWNMAHLVNVRKVERINAVNDRSGLPRIRIHTPEEVLDL